MFTHKSVPKSRKCYQPHDAVVSFLKDMLSWQAKKEEIQRDTNAGVKDGLDIESRIEELDHVKLNLNARKVGFLNSYIFPSMANLTIFLEAVSKGSFASNMFEDDLNQLFFAKSSVQNPTLTQSEKSIFARFIEAGCRNVPSDNFRLMICSIMQEIIFFGLQEVASSKFQDKFEDASFLSSIMIPDIWRAHSWTVMLSLEARKNLLIDEESRPPLF